jgi:hypothetical protein
MRPRVLKENKAALKGGKKAIGNPKQWGHDTHPPTKILEGGRTFEYEQAFNQKYSGGWAAFLNELSKKIEPWSTAELQQLRSAARMGQCGDSLSIAANLTAPHRDRHRLPA